MRGLRSLALGVLAATTVFVAQPAKASLLFEPYVGYESGRFHTDPSTDWNFSGTAVGARLGVAFPVLFLALDYQTFLNGKLTNGTSPAPDQDVTGYTGYADVGFSLPLIRGYVGYGLLNKFNFKNGIYENTSEGGTAYKVGVGTTLLPIVAINLEYQHSDYDKGNGNSNLKSNSNFYMLSVSVPFNF